MAEAREAGRNVLLPPPVVSMTFARANTKWYCIALVTAVMVGVAITKIMPPMTFESIGFSPGASAKKPLTDDDAMQIVNKYQNGFSFSETRRSNISYGTRDGVCKSPWEGGPVNILPVPPASHIKGLPGGMAFDLLNGVFKGLLSEDPTAILGDLAKTFADSIANEMSGHKCAPRPAIVGQFCSFQSYDVPQSYATKQAVAKQDSLAEDAYSRTCNDETGSKLVMGSPKLDFCAMVLSMIYCAQALPACSKVDWDSNCLDTCVLANHCAMIVGGKTVSVKDCKKDICPFPGGEPGERDGGINWLAIVFWMIFVLVVILGLLFLVWKKVLTEARRTSLWERLPESFRQRTRWLV